VALAYIQVETHALVELPLFRVARHDRSQQCGRPGKLVRLQSREAFFVKSDGFNVSGAREWDGYRRILRRAAVALMRARVWGN